MSFKNCYIQAVELGFTPDSDSLCGCVCCFGFVICFVSMSSLRQNSKTRLPCLFSDPFAFSFLLRLKHGSRSHCPDEGILTAVGTSHTIALLISAEAAFPPTGDASVSTEYSRLPTHWEFCAMLDTYSLFSHCIKENKRLLQVSSFWAAEMRPVFLLSICVVTWDKWNKGNDFF